MKATGLSDCNATACASIRVCTPGLNSRNTTEVQLRRQSNVDGSDSEQSDGLLQTSDTSYGIRELYTTDDENLSWVSAVKVTLAPGSCTKVENEGKANRYDHPTAKPQDEEERKRRSGYRSSKRFLSKMETRDRTTLTDREKSLMKRHRRIVKKFKEV